VGAAEGVGLQAPLKDEKLVLRMVRL